MANGENQNLTEGRELNYLTQRDSYLGSILGRIIKAVNSTATNAGVAAVGKTSPPPKIDSINVQGTMNSPAGAVPGALVTPGEILHWTMTHNQSVNKGIRYFSEIDTDPNFPQPHVVDHGTSRSGFLTLPTYVSDAGPLPTNNIYYLRSYAQYPGSDPCEPKVFGNLGGAIPIQMAGSNVTPLLPSTGSGTASAQGQQGGKGLGTVIKRPTPQSKRALKRT
jgi:hypothetical protein